MDNLNTKSLWTIVWLLVPSMALADGVAIFGVSGDGIARADAISASVNDASAVWYNPARVATVQGTNVEFSPVGLWFNAKNESSASPGATVKNEANAFFIPAFYVTTKAGTNQWGFGLGVNAPYAIGVSYPHGAPFAGTVSHAALETVNIAPTVAYKVSDAFSVGASLNYYRAHVELEKFPNLGAFGTGVLTVDDDGDGLGFSLGTSYKLAEKHSLSLLYRSQVVLQVDGTLNSTFGFTLPTGVTSGDQPTKSTLRLPDNVVFGYAFTPDDAWTFEFDAVWRNWNDVGRVNLTNSATGTQQDSIQFDWSNGFEIGTSVVHKFNDFWTLKGGYLFSKTPVSEETFNMAVPETNYHLFTVAPALTCGALSLQVPLGVAFGPSRTINNNVGAANAAAGITNGNPNGKVSLLAIKAGLSASYRFGGQ